MLTQPTCHSSHCCLSQCRCLQIFDEGLHSIRFCHFRVYVMLRDFVAWPGAMLEEVLGLPSVGVCPLPLTLCADYLYKSGAPDAAAYIPAVGTKFTTHMVGASACSATCCAFTSAPEVRTLFGINNGSLARFSLPSSAAEVTLDITCVHVTSCEGVPNVVLCSAGPLRSIHPCLSSIWKQCPACNSIECHFIPIVSAIP